MTRRLPVQAIYFYSSRHVKGVQFFNGRYTKGAPCLSKMAVYETVRNAKFPSFCLASTFSTAAVEWEGLFSLAKRYS